MPSRRHELAGGAASPLLGGAEKPKSERERKQFAAGLTPTTRMLSLALLCVLALSFTPKASASVVLTVRCEPHISERGKHRRNSASDTTTSERLR